MLSWLIEPQGEEQELPDDIGLDRMTRIINLTEELPPMPQVASKAMEIMNDPESSMEELTAVLNEDQSLLAMIIKVSNSALYSSSQSISTLQGAVAKLGITIIHSLVLSAAASSLFPERDKEIDQLSTKLWHHSQACGLAARIIASTINYPAPEEAFVGGLLHDIGRLAILIHYPEQYKEIDKKLGQSDSNHIALELQLLDFDHTSIGQLLAAKWHLPDLLQSCIEQHHAPLEASESCRQLTAIVALADYLSQNPQQEELSVAKTGIILTVEEALGLDEAMLAQINSQVKEQFQHLAAM